MHYVQLISATPSDLEKRAAQTFIPESKDGRKECHVPSIPTPKNYIRFHTYMYLRACSVLLLPNLKFAQFLVTFALKRRKCTNMIIMIYRFPRNEN